MTEQKINELELEDNFNRRFINAPWTKTDKIVSVVGLGNTGSWLTFCLAKSGLKVYALDPDTVDIVNIGTQLYGMEHLDTHKAAALFDICNDFLKGHSKCISKVGLEDENNYNFSIYSTEILCCMVDSMSARKLIFDRFLKSSCELFIDPRTGPDNCIIRTVKKEPKSIETYKKSLYSDEEASNFNCGFTATPAVGLGVASLITGIITNHLSNVVENEDIYPIPEYLNFNLTMLSVL